MGRWTKEEQELAEDAAQATIGLFDSGQKNVSAADIVAALYPGLRTYPYMERRYANLMLWIKNRVKNARPQWIIYGVNEYFYRAGFDLTPPEESTEARRCLPGGNGRDVRGISICRNGETDAIWQAHNKQVAAIGTGVTLSSVKELVGLVQSGELTPETAMGMLKEQAVELPPDELEAARLLLKAAEQEELPFGPRVNA